ncbi:MULTISPECIES: nucleotidyltransferase domain-containing protein [Mycobacterium]|nr:MULTISPECIES: nucleotidyltransferase domain-containing protein [Mycobacterium]
MAELIVRACDPEEVLLFGSFAKGRQREHSDIDLLVITAKRASDALRHELRDLLLSFPVSVDVRLLTPDEARAAWADRGCFLQSILSSAVPLYVRGERSIVRELAANP